VAPGNKTFPLQRGQDIPKLGTADAKKFGKDTFPGKAVTVRILTILHGGKKLGTDGFGFIEYSGHTKSSSILKVIPIVEDLRLFYKWQN
jgi:hypothetical protein